MRFKTEVIRGLKLHASLLSLGFFFFTLSLSFPTAHGAVLSTDPIEQLHSTAIPESAPSASGTSAKITALEGDVKILKKGSESWAAAEKNQSIDVGDQILTGKNSSVDIAYDTYLLNISHLKENTKAEVRSLNPTDIYLEDGTIFSALDGLSGQGGYQIATPTAVAAVRGTHFDVGYDKTSQKFTAAALPTGDENHVSKIFVSDPQEPTTSGVEVIENKQLDLTFGEPIQQNLIKPADPARLEAGKAVFAQMGERMPRFQELRAQGKEHLQEMRRPDQNPNEFKPDQNRKDLKNDENLLKNMKEKQENSKIDKEKPADTNAFENIQGLDELANENKAQERKPFGSFRPQIKEGFTQAQRSSSEDMRENQNPSSGQMPAKLRPFGEMRPQSIGMGSSPRPGFGTQNQPGQHAPEFQSPQQSGEQTNRPQNSARPQGPPPGPPKR